MEKSLIIEKVREKRKYITLTLAMLLVAAAETWYLNCYKDSTLWCPFTWFYILLALPVIFVLAYYR